MQPIAKEANAKLNYIVATNTTEVREIISNLKQKNSAGLDETEAKSRHEGQSHALLPLRRANEVQTVTSAFRNKYSTLP
ncbi:hypothetical protein J6590_035579 [Homalodisca vitripennis]|nr:hypothetical protein J6590_035579 [Homalodisca vitripennis]